MQKEAQQTYVKKTPPVLNNVAPVQKKLFSGLVALLQMLCGLLCEGRGTKVHVQVVWSPSKCMRLFCIW